MARVSAAGELSSSLLVFLKIREMKNRFPITTEGYLKGCLLTNWKVSITIGKLNFSEI